MIWADVGRPGFLGRGRDRRVAQWDRHYGHGRWRLVWRLWRLVGPPAEVLGFEDACRAFYEESYVRHLRGRPDDIDFLCSFENVIDNAPSNVRSGCDYSLQEAPATHIQDIALRCALRKLGVWFRGDVDRVLVVRGADSEGARFSPGVVPFYDLDGIELPSKCPRWAKSGSVEDFWQSNKFLQRAVD